MMRGFWELRSDAQAVEVVMFEAKEDIRGVQVVRLAAHVASRVWEMRTRDLESWKKELEFYRLLETIDQLRQRVMERGKYLEE